MQRRHEGFFKLLFVINRKYLFNKMQLA